MLFETNALYTKYLFSIKKDLKRGLLSVGIKVREMISLASATTYWRELIGL